MWGGTFMIKDLNNIYDKINFAAWIDRYAFSSLDCGPRIIHPEPVKVKKRLNYSPNEFYLNKIFFNSIVIA